jgi:hypothetical protein
MHDLTGEQREIRCCAAREWLAKLDEADLSAVPDPDPSQDWSPSAPPSPWFLVGQAESYLWDLLDVIDSLTD